ncbi:MAG: hypothetical protein QG673_1196 [Pseudomonadota bacterium]|nr:hypothetical protein [Pseudomonadota bacterium]
MLVAKNSSLNISTTTFKNMFVAVNVNGNKTVVFHPVNAYVSASSTAEGVFGKLLSLITGKKQMSPKEQVTRVNEFVQELDAQINHCASSPGSIFNVELSKHRNLNIFLDSYGEAVFSIQKTSKITKQITLIPIAKLTRQEFQGFKQTVKTQHENITKVGVVSFSGENIETSYSAFQEFDAKSEPIKYEFKKADDAPQNINDFKQDNKEVHFILHGGKIYYVDNDKHKDTFGQIQSLSYENFSKEVLCCENTIPALDKEDVADLNNIFNNNEAYKKYLRLDPKFKKNVDKTNEAFFVALGSGDSVAKNQQKIEAKQSYLINQATALKKASVGEVEIVDGPKLATGAGFDQNVETLAKSMLTHIVTVYKNSSNKDNLEINLNLTGHSRGASEVVAAYNLLQKYLRSDSNTPPEITGLLDSVVWDSIQGLRAALNSGSVGVITSMHLFDPVRGPDGTNGKYGIYGKEIEEPVGSETKSKVFVDLHICNKATVFNTIINRFFWNKVLELSHITVKNSNNIHLRYNVMVIGHEGITTKSKYNTGIGPLVDDILGSGSKQARIEAEFDMIESALGNRGVSSGKRGVLLIQYTGSITRKIANLLATMKPKLPNKESEKYIVDTKIEVFTKLANSQKILLTKKIEFFTKLADSKAILSEDKIAIFTGFANSDMITLPEKTEFFTKLADSEAISLKDITAIFTGLAKNEEIPLYIKTAIFTGLANSNILPVDKTAIFTGLANNNKIPLEHKVAIFTGLANSTVITSDSKTTIMNELKHNNEIPSGSIIPIIMAINGKFFEKESKEEIIGVVATAQAHEISLEDKFLVLNSFNLDVKVVNYIKKVIEMTHVTYGDNLILNLLSHDDIIELNHVFLTNVEQQLEAPTSSGGNPPDLVKLQERQQTLKPGDIKNDNEEIVGTSFSAENMAATLKLFFNDNPKLVADLTIETLNSAYDHIGDYQAIIAAITIVFAALPQHDVSHNAQIGNN